MSLRYATGSRDPFVMVHRLPSLSLVFTFLAWIPAVYAAPAPPSQTNITQRYEPNTTPSSWSKDEIFTFIGVLVAIIGIVVTLVFYSPKVHQWLCCPFRCKW
jgi:hypothetical protein